MISPKLIYYNISPNTTAFTTTREGGCSSGQYATFNANHYCGDNPQHVAANRTALCALLGIPPDHLVVPHQTHGTDLRIIDQHFMSESDEQRTLQLESIDATMTDMSGVALCVSTADCVPILIYDPIHHAAAAVHAGWRGTVARISELTLQAMNSRYGTRGHDCCAIIGPSISVDCFEVGDEVYDAFAMAGFDMQAIAVRHAKWHIDLWECNRLQLESQGVSHDKITMADICTYRQSDRFFSARKLGINSGRMLTGIIMQ